MSKTKFFKVTKLPIILQPHSFYYVHDGVDYVESFLTDAKRKLHPIGNSEMINNLIDNKLQEFNPGDVVYEEVEDYRSSFEDDKYIYSGFLLNEIPVIKRVKDSIEQFAQNVLDLEPYWTNRLLLNYI